MKRAKQKYFLAPTFDNMILRLRAFQVPKTWRQARKLDRLRKRHRQKPPITDGRTINWTP